MRASSRAVGLGLFSLCVALSACDGALSGAPSPTTPIDNTPSLNNQPATPEPETPAPSMPFEAAPASLPRLTNAQYINALKDIFGPSLPGLALEPDTNPYLFYSIGASTTVVSSYGVERYSEAAGQISRAVFAAPARRDALLGCQLQSVDAQDPCLNASLERLGLRLYRRPLDAVELGRWSALAQELASPDEPYAGLEMALAGMLQSAHFIYRVELGEPDPEDATRYRYTSWEMAQRLAILLWNSIPDEALLEAASQGLLLDDDSLNEQVDRMLQDPRARAAVQDFFAQYLDLKRLDDVQRDPARYPGYVPSLLDAMRTEVKLLVDDIIFTQDQDIRTLFSAKRSFVNDQLAALYEVDAPGAARWAFVPVTFDASSPRAGVLTLGAFLTINAHPTETSPTLRGKYLRERIFCQQVPPPPDNVNLDLSEMNGQPRTLRERLEQHRDDPNCSGCHSFIDPPGYLFERFDSVGRYREQLDGITLDSSGALNGVALAHATELGQLLAQDEVLPSCLLTQLYRHANARLNLPQEQAALDQLLVEFKGDGYRFQSLLRALVLSPGFRTLAKPSEL